MSDYAGAMKRSIQMGMAVLLLTGLWGCQALTPAHPSKSNPAGPEKISPRTLAEMLSGEYDNHEQVWRSQNATPAAPVHHRLLLAAHQAENHAVLLWRLDLMAKTPLTAIWLYRIESRADGKSIQLIPHRAIDPSKMAARVSDPKPFEFNDAEWTAFPACTLVGEWKHAQLNAAVDRILCNAVLPELGETSALLPLRVSNLEEGLSVATLADQARGEDADERARRVRWFGGWSALNGAGPQAKADSNDWHSRYDLRLHNEGGRTPLRWRDGAASGYSIELSRLTYAESKTPVLKLAVIEDASGKTLIYTWANPEATRIGINMGWLQIGLEQK